jgi:hypothetical protein
MLFGRTKDWLGWDLEDAGLLKRVDFFARFACGGVAPGVYITWHGLVSIVYRVFKIEVVPGIRPQRPHASGCYCSWY